MTKSLPIILVGSVLAGALLASACGDNGQNAPSPQTEAPAATAPAEKPAVSENERETQTAPGAQDASANAQDSAGPGDPVRGKRVFVKCMACHSAAEGENRVGPSLYKIVGAPSARTTGFNYSPAVAGLKIVWTEENLTAYLENPAKYVPGNKMLFPGLPSAQDRADVIAYLKSIE